MHEYFFELLTEEIPAWMLPPRLATLEKELREFYEHFAGKVPATEAVVVGATSRRVFFALQAMPQQQPDRQEELKGPPVKVAYDSGGNPTAALTGFLRKNSATVDQAERRDDYVWLRRTVRGAKAVDAIRDSVPAIVENLRWPKMMRWGSGEFSYIRPVHSVISIFDGDPVPVRIFGVASSTATLGHRILANRSVQICSYDDYRKKLRELHVIVDADERIGLLGQRAENLAHEMGGSPSADEAIWEQWRYLTEHPGVVRAEFSREYLKLPTEVLITVMRVHQKQLPILKNDQLANSFLAIMDGPVDVDGNVASGNGFVTNARFADARFFYEVDRKRPLEDRIPQLAHLQFQEKLGDYGAKTDRMASLALDIHRAAASSSDPNQLAQAARLCKADLVTEMVKEFTDLQGKIGGIYAREEGKPAAVWQAIYDHYLPHSIDGELPRTESGAIVSLSDKIDTLCGFFSIGMKPSGSRDPFALRRAAQGVVQLLLTRQPWQIEVSLEQLLDFGLARFRTKQARTELLEFFAERVRTILESSRYGGFAYDEVNAVMESGWSNSLLDLVDRATALRAVRNTPEFLSILDSAKRIANITEKSMDSRVSENLLQHPTEKRLASLATAVGEQIDELAGNRQYRAALESFAGLAPELEKFFVDVLVMVDDDSLRKNRMALLRKVGSAVNKIADVTKVVVDRSEYAPTA